MSKTILLIIVLLYICHPCSAQTTFAPPNYEAIAKSTSDILSDMYYPTLLKRYHNSDTTLDLNEYKTLYYGALFHEDIETREKSYPIGSDIRSFLNAAELTEEDYGYLYGLHHKYLELIPFDPKRLYSAYQLAKHFGDTAAAEAYLMKSRSITRAILSTGDGLTDSTGYHVAYVGDEYLVLEALGYIKAGRHSLSYNISTYDLCHYIEVADNKKGIKRLFFDVDELIAMYKRANADKDDNNKKRRRKRRARR